MCFWHCVFFLFFLGVSRGSKANDIDTESSSSENSDAESSSASGSGSATYSDSVTVSEDSESQEEYKPGKDVNIITRGGNKKKNNKK